jgi:histidine triad (HIT) family protein
MDCIFCKIVKGDIPSYKVFENEDLIAILDISQATKGHTLIIPKIHKKNLYEMDSKTAGKIFEVVPKIANAIKKAYNPIGLNVLINTERPLQSVDHFHIHLLPRYENDDIGFSFENHQKDMTNDLYREVQTNITKNL